MSMSQWLALFFFMFSVVVFVFLCFFTRKKNLRFLPRKFLLLASAVYCSGTLLVLIISLAEEALTAPRVLITELIVVGTAVATVFLMSFYSKQLVEVAGVKQSEPETELDSVSEEE